MKEKEIEKFKTLEEARAHIYGRIAGINDVRISVWGIGYDKDETAQKIRKYTSEKIYELKEMLEIDYFGDTWFESAVDFLKNH